MDNAPTPTNGTRAHVEGLGERLRRLLAHVIPLQRPGGDEAGEVGIPIQEAAAGRRGFPHIREGLTRLRPIAEQGVAGARDFSEEVMGRARNMLAGDAGPSISADVALAAASVNDAAKRTMITELRGSHDTSIETVTAAARLAVREASAVGADITAAAVGAVDGALLIARRRGIDADAIASAAAAAAVEEAGRLSDQAATRVREAIQRQVPGTTVVVVDPADAGAE